MKLKAFRVIQNETPKMAKMSVSTNKLLRFFAEHSYNGFSTSTAVVTFCPNYVYVATHKLMSSSSYIAACVPSVYTIYSMVCYCINGLYGRNHPGDMKKLSRFFLFKPDSNAMKIIEATTKIGGFNQHLPMRQSNQWYPYSGLKWHKDDTINTLYSSVWDQNGTTAIGFIVGTNTLLTDVYDTR